MISRLFDSLGVFLYPQLALSVMVSGLCLSYLLAALRGDFRRMADRPWRRQLEPLGSIAVSLGLLGSVWAFIVAFSGFTGGIDVDRIVQGLGTAYTTTGVGLVTAIVAGLGSYVFDLMAKSDPATERPSRAVRTTSGAQDKCD